MRLTTQTARILTVAADIANGMDCNDGQLAAVLMQGEVNGVQNLMVPGVGSASNVQEARKLQVLLRQLWGENEDSVAEAVNLLLAEAGARPQICRDVDGRYVLQQVSLGTAGHQAAVQLAMAFVELLVCGELGRLRICGRSDCNKVMVDLSKNRSKRFCDITCGNQVAVGAYRARKIRGSQR